MIMKEEWFVFRPTNIKNENRKLAFETAKDLLKDEKRESSKLFNLASKSVEYFLRYQLSTESLRHWKDRRMEHINVIYFCHFYIKEYEKHYSYLFSDFEIEIVRFTAYLMYSNSIPAPFNDMI